MGKKIVFEKEHLEFYEKREKTISELRNKLANIANFHPRAFKLIMKEKPFVVVAIDEPYFKTVYELIRSEEMKKGTWRYEDEKSFEKGLEINQKILRDDE